MKTIQDWWWSYWGNKELERSIQGGLNHPIAKFLLWKYENHLEAEGKGGYIPTRYDRIISPELEHIAPQTENQYINCIGNYLLLSKSHSCYVGNKPFAEKRDSYNYLIQQLKIQKMTTENMTWTKDFIKKRRDKIIKFVIENV